MWAKVRDRAKEGHTRSNENVKELILTKDPIEIESEHRKLWRMSRGQKWLE